MGIKFRDRQGPKLTFAKINFRERQKNRELAKVYTNKVHDVAESLCRARGIIVYHVSFISTEREMAVQTQSFDELLKQLDSLIKEEQNSPPVAANKKK